MPRYFKLNLKNAILVFACFATLTLPLLATEPLNFNGDYSRIVAAIKSGNRSPVDFTRAIAPNVTHRFLYDPDKPWLINIVEMKFDAPPGMSAPLQVTAEAGQDTLYGGQRTTQMAQRVESEGAPVVCAINADFYGSNHRPVGLFIDDGHIFKNPHTRRPVFAVGKSGKFYITETTLNVIVNVGTDEYQIDAINPESSKGNGALYTHKNNMPITFDENFSWFRLKPRTKTFLPNETALLDYLGPLEVAENFKITDGEFVFSLPKDGELAAKLSTLSPPSTVRIFPKVPEIPEPITMAVGGIPRIITDGKVDVAWEKAGIRENFSTTEHPRTAVGFSRDGLTLWFITVDGRQPGVSRGIALDDLAAFMLDLGCWQAVNLDGGGSTTMMVRGQITNSPSDLGGERSVSNSVMLAMNPEFATAAKKIRPAIYPQNVLLPTLANCRFRVEWLDEYLNPVNQTEASAAFATEGNIGTITPDGLFKAGETAAKGKIIARGSADASLEASTSVEVAQLQSVTFHPKILMMRNGEEQTFAYQVNSRDGRKFFMESDSLSFTYPEFIKPVMASNTLLAEAPGKGQIVLEVAGNKYSLPVYVDQFKEVTVQSFDALPAAIEGKPLLDGKLFKEDKTRVTVTKEIKREGTAALKWEYGMQPGGTTAIYLNSETALPGEPMRLGVWVWGDGKGTWLRGILQDADGERFLIDWTGSGGIYWRDDWKYLEFNLEDLTPYFDNPQGVPDMPFTLISIYLAQQKEADKADSAIVLDALTATYAPVN